MELSIKAEKGQSLLVIVLLISVVFTIIAAASFRFTTETQTTKLQQDTIRALAAADSGIERGLQVASTLAQTTATFSSLGMTLEGIDLQRSTIEIKKTGGRDFLAPTIKTDEQYTFYLYNHPTNNGDTTNYYQHSTNGPLNLYFADSGTSCGASRSMPAVEVTLIYGSGASSDKHRRWVVEACPGSPRITGSGMFTGIPTTQSIEGTQFNRVQQFTLLPANYPNPKLFIVRTFFAPTKLAFRASNLGGRLFAQGQEITVKAVTNTGSSRVVQLFKPNPQIPADFFVTTF